jgi:hypothetical protein
MQDLVLGILSLAADRGVTQFPLVELFRCFADLSDRFPTVIPFVFERAPYTVYSKAFDDALQALVGYSVDLPNPQLQYIELAPEAARRHVTGLRAKYGDGFISSLAPASQDLAGKLGARA